MGVAGGAVIRCALWSVAAALFLSPALSLNAGPDSDGAGTHESTLRMELESRLKQANEAVSSAAAKISDLERQLSKSKSDAAAVLRDIESAKSEAQIKAMSAETELRTLKSVLDRERSSSRGELAAVRKDIAEREDRLAKLSSRLGQREKEMEETISALNAAKAQIESGKAEMSAVQRRCEALKKDIEARARLQIRLEKDLAETGRLAAKREAELAARVKTLEDAVAGKEELEARLAAAVKRISVMESDLVRLRSEKDAPTAGADQPAPAPAGQPSAEIRDFAARQKEEQSRSAAASAELRSSLESAATEKARLEAKLADAEKQASARNTEISRLRSEKESALSELKTASERARVASSGLEEKSARLADAEKRAAVAEASLKTATVELASAIKASEESARTLHAELEKIRKSASDDLKAAVGKASARADAAEKAVGALRAELEDTRKTAAVAAGEAAKREARLKEEIAASSAAISGLKSDLQESKDKTALEILHRRGLAARNRPPSLDNPSVASALNDAALVLAAEGRTEEAVRLFVKSITAFEASAGGEHPAVGTVMANLADLYMAANESAKAAAFYRRALELQEKAYGDTSLTVASTANSLGSALRQQGDLDRAEEAYGKSIAVYGKAGKAGRPDLAAPLNNLALLQITSKRYSEAETNLRRAMEIVEQGLGNDHENLVPILRNMTALNAALGRSEALKACEDRISAILAGGRGPAQKK